MLGSELDNSFSPMVIFLGGLVFYLFGPTQCFIWKTAFEQIQGGPIFLCTSSVFSYSPLKICLLSFLLKPAEKSQESVLQVLETGCKPVLL